MAPPPVSEDPVVSDEEESSQMTKTASTPQHFVLVHGIGHGAWCWYKIRCLLEKSGYKVSCIDLKSAGIDPSDPDTIFTLEEYNKPLIDFLSTLPENEKIILVGHSAGGVSVTHAVHTYGKKIHLAIYVAATMLRFGFLTDQDLLDGAPQLSEFGDVYDFGFGLGLQQAPTSVIIKKKFQHKIIYQMSPLEDSALASMLLKPGPLRALQSARFVVEEEDVDQVQRVYIKTMNDHVIKPNQQDAMINKWPPSDIFVLESDHSPFFSVPSELFGLLVKATATATSKKIFSA
ncbi:Methylesterase [Thalictrum thalictroides]|uniref:Methylesterase n=1 Tax=Thalictrum thalictroides TaxID=46969 RepID=A0A7J6WSY6_THATH|nr:Methylesterase [Thalictrum thalictroides]